MEHYYNECEDFDFENGGENCSYCLNKFIDFLENELKLLKASNKVNLKKIDDLAYENGALKAEIDQFKLYKKHNLYKISKSRLQVDINNLQKENIFLKSKIKLLNVQNSHKCTKFSVD